ncbi:hypothetical protein NL676_037025 [Syzygium grande]|nr:hypothetical protein NL676_037025 [Syzygium grande]
MTETSNLTTAIRRPRAAAASSSSSSSVHRRRRHRRPVQSRTLQPSLAGERLDHALLLFESGLSGEDPSQRCPLVRSRRRRTGAVLGEGIRARVLELRDELVQLGGRDEIVRALEEKADPLLLSVDGLAFVELLKQLDAWPHQALEVLIRSTRSLSWQFCKD